MIPTFCKSEAAAWTKIPENFENWVPIFIILSSMKKTMTNVKFILIRAII